MDRTSRLRAHIESEMRRGGGSKADILNGLPADLREAYPDVRALNGAVSGIYAAAQRAADRAPKAPKDAAPEDPATRKHVVLRSPTADEEEFNSWFPDDPPIGAARRPAQDDEAGALPAAGDGLSTAESIDAFFADGFRAARGAVEDGALEDLKEIEAVLEDDEPGADAGAPKRGLWNLAYHVREAAENLAAIPEDSRAAAFRLSLDDLDEASREMMLSAFAAHRDVEPKDRLRIAVLETRLATLEEALRRGTEPETSPMSQIKAGLLGLIGRGERA